MVHPRDDGRDWLLHSQTKCRAANVSKTVLEGASAGEPALLQPSAGYMRLIKHRILYVWNSAR